MNGLLQFCLNGRVPVDEGLVVEEVLEYLTDPVEHANDRILLQAKCCTVVKRTVREGHRAAILLHHRNNTLVDERCDFRLTQVQACTLHVAQRTILLTSGTLCDNDLVGIRHASCQSR